VILVLRVVVQCDIEYSVAFVNFFLPVQASYPTEPAWASLPCCSICLAKPDVVILSSSGTEEALELLSIR
jgi:hypothetical protein